MNVGYFFLGTLIASGIFFYQFREIRKFYKHDPNLGELKTISFLLMHIGILLTGAIVAYIFGN